MNIKELSKKLKMKPAIVRSVLRRKVPHQKGQRWDINARQVPRVIKLLKEEA